MNKLDLVKMMDIADVTSAKRIFARDYVTSGIPFYRGKEITELHRGALNVSTDLFITAEKFSEIKKKHGAPEEGDILLTSVGTLGSVYLVKPGDKFYFKDGNVTWFRNLAGVMGAYLRYWLISPEGRAQLQKCMIGSSQSAYTIENLKRMEIRLPPLETQRRIASILGAYDDLIEVNRRRIAVLEEMARGLFEDWFVRFRFPGHETVPILDTPDGPLPEGWHYAALNEIAEVAFGFAFKSKAFSATPEGARVVRIRDVPSGTTQTWTTELFDPRYAVINGDILIGMDGIFHMALWVGGDAALNQRVTRLRPINGYSKGWVFLSVYPHIKFFEATISGTTVAHLGAKHLNTIRVPVADPVTQAKADRFFTPIDEELVNLRVANQRLAASRDLLLPRLISGQLSVAQAERQLEEAA
ncbi:MAG: restriction endonuclease subunit S [Sphingopyxis granuli]|uniref:restriction endonuclease subunit S n=1 Tax=Sphingopyxis granuli TaxID=267128 RepID=UPI003C765FBD